jgi:phenylacetate-CoA ligase
MREWLASKIVFPLREHLSSQTFWSGYLELKRLQWMPREELLGRSFQKCQSLVTHSYDYVPYYRELFQEAGINPRAIKDLSDLSRVPITSKADLRKNFPDKVIAKGIQERQIRKGQTSGSTGLPLQFYSDLGHMDIVRSSYLLFSAWAGVGPWVTRVVIANPPHFYSQSPTSGRFERAVRRVLLGDRLVRIAGLDLTLEEYLSHAERFTRWGPHYLLSFPSYADRLASEIIEAGVELPAYPVVFVSQGETLTEFDRELIKKTFQSEVINRYGSLEVPNIAQTCPDNPDLLHVDVERVLVRVVRDDGTEALPGEMGRIVITDFANYVMPFINYDTGDWGVAGDACPCGRGLPTLARLEGRTSEVIRTPSGRLVSSSTLGPLLVDVWETVPAIWEYQAVQIADDRVVLKVVPGSNYTGELEKKLARGLEEFLGKGMRVELEPVDRIETEPSGKRLIIKSHLTAS